MKTKPRKIFEMTNNLTKLFHICSLNFSHENSQHNSMQHARVDIPGKSMGGHRSSTTVPSMATSVAVTVFAVGIGGHRWAIGGERWATDGPSVGYGWPPESVDERFEVRFSQVPTEKEIRCLKNGFLDIYRNANTDTTLGTLARKIIIIKQPNKTKNISG